MSFDLVSEWYFYPSDRHYMLRLTFKPRNEQVIVLDTSAWWLQTENPDGTITTTVLEELIFPGGPFMIGPKGERYVDVTLYDAHPALPAHPALLHPQATYVVYGTDGRRYHTGVSLPAPESFTPPL